MRVARKSDAYRMIICQWCGRAMCHNGTTCVACRSNGQRESRPVVLTVPYSFKLLLQEMVAMGIDWQMQVAKAGCTTTPSASASQRRTRLLH